MRKTTILLLSALAFVLLSAETCETTQDNKDEQATDARMSEMRAQVGLCNITNFTEAKFAKLTCELRDQEIKTWSYYLDMNGGRHLLCESVGYGLPYSVQTTNPELVVYSGTSLPQAEPNGLFMPGSADATWVLCSNGSGGVAPVYVEPKLIVSPFPLGHVEAAKNSGFDDKVEIQKLVPSKSPDEGMPKGGTDGPH
jgi:hypothetical protein